MNKIFGFFLVLLTFAHCSLDTKTGLWTKKQTIKKNDKYYVYPIDPKGIEGNGDMQDNL